ncbi:MAG: hypothetical protein ACLQVD_09360, partial [Capsulimonadaceae bacterium]
MLHARGGICLFTDADLSSPMTEARKLFDAISRGADIAIGSRWLRVELQTERQPLYRQAFGRIFNLICGLPAFVFRSIASIASIASICSFVHARSDKGRFPMGNGL